CLLPDRLCRSKYREINCEDELRLCHRNVLAL
ncbi:MAG: hypothetical protein ACI8QF_001431, partial [Limisphaerales bacterium]